MAPNNHTDAASSEQKHPRGLAVLGYLPGSYAVQAGVQKGDRLLKVNGLQINTLSDYVQAARLDPDLMMILLERQGSLLELSIPLRTSRLPAVNSLGSPTQS